MSKPSAILCALSALLIAAALLLLRPPGEPGVAMRDFEAYYSAGATWLAHADPYSLAIWNAERQVPGVVAARHEVLPFVGVPSTVPFWAAFAHMSYDASKTGWAALLAISLAIVAILTARLLRFAAWRAALVALASLAFVPITSNFGLGQAALPAYAATLAALTAPPILGVVAVFFAALQPNVALGLLVLFARRNGSIALIAGALLIVAAGCVAMGWSWIVEYARVLGAHASAERFAVIQYTPAAVLYGFGVPKTTASAVAVIIALLAVAAAVGGVIRASSLVRRFCIACCAIPFVAGFFHEHDFVALFASALFAVAYARRAWAATLGCALVGINWLDFAQQPQAVAQDAVLACGLLCALIALRPQREQFVAAGVALLSIAAGAWIGAVHHLPIWPNDMHGVAAGASIAEVWKNEQLQTGLMRPDAAAALLRSFALLGSALLLWSTLDVDVHHVVERGDRVGLEVL